MSAGQTSKGTDAELLSSAAAEDFGAFYSRHVSAVTAYVARRVEGPEAAFDVVAETFARALEHRRAYDPSRGPAIAWLVGIARHLIADALRRGAVDAAARRRLGMAPVSLDDEQLALIEERGRLDFASALSSLPPDQQEAVLRRVLEEEPYPSLAARLGCSEQVVRKRVSRGLAQLRRNLEGPKP
jgi:RNA polymerase sigma factor (sigma-70 family)